MKSFLCTLFALSMSCALWADVFWADPATGEEVPEGQGLKWTYYVENGNITIGSGSSQVSAISKETSGRITIPTIIDGKSVTKLGSGAFGDCSALTSINLPAGVTSIGGHAFSGCRSLTSISLPNGVTSIGNNAFDDCSSLTSISLPAGLTSIGTQAFYCCSLLTAVDLPAGLTSIGSGTFSGCSSLTSVDLPAGLTSIGTQAFYCCSLLVSVDLPARVTSIGDWAFSGCSALQVAAFHGAPPEGVRHPKIHHGIPLEKIRYPKAYAKEWIAAIGDERQGLTDIYSQAQVTATAKMLDSTQMKVTYKVTYPEGVTRPERVNVRAVAFKDGIRSFANLVPVVTDGSAPDGQTVGKVPNGTEVTVGAEQSFVWDISGDWASNDVKLGQVSVEILVQENGKLLPQELITIPEVKAADGVAAHPEMTITRNTVPEPMLFKALLWRYAELAQTDKGALSNELAIVSNKEEAAGKVYWNKNKAEDFATKPAAKGVLIAWGDKINDGRKQYSSDTRYPINETELLTYLYGRMGFEVLEGKNLDWAREATRLGLQSGTADVEYEGMEPILQRAVKINQPSTQPVKE